MISVDKIPYQRQIDQKSSSKTHDRHKTAKLIINVRKIVRSISPHVIGHTVNLQPKAGKGQSSGAGS